MSGHARAAIANYFIALYEEGTVTRAAYRLNIAQQFVYAKYQNK